MILSGKTMHAVFDVNPDQSALADVSLEVVQRTFHDHPSLINLLRSPAPRKLSWHEVDEILRYEWGLVLYGLVAPAACLWTAIWCALLLLMLLGVLPMQNRDDLPMTVLFLGIVGFAPLAILGGMILWQLYPFRKGELSAASIHDIKLVSQSDESLWSLTLRYSVGGNVHCKQYLYDEEQCTIGPLDQDTALALYALQAPILVLAVGKHIKWLAWPEQVSKYRK